MVGNIQWQWWFKPLIPALEGINELKAKLIYRVPRQKGKKKEEKRLVYNSYTSPHPWGLLFLVRRLFKKS